MKEGLAKNTHQQKKKKKSFFFCFCVFWFVYGERKIFRGDPDIPMDS